MKNLFKIFLLSILVFTVGCENEDDPRFQDNPETGWAQFASSSTTVAVTSRTGTVNIPVNFTAPINLSDLTISFNVSDVTGTSANVIESLGSSITIVANTNTNNLQLNFKDDAVDQLIANGDVEFDIELTSATRGIQVGLADDSVPTVHRVNLLCGGEPQPGTYTVEMHDSFGDGWQTDDANGGSGMTVTLIDVNGDETVIEFGMCTPYSASAGTFLFDGDCTPGSFDATKTIDIPAGIVDAVWEFPGDWYGEISFEIFTPSGSLLYASGAAGDQAAGTLQLSYCI